MKFSLGAVALAGALASFGVMFFSADAQARACDPDTGRCYGVDEKVGPRPAYMATPRSRPAVRPSIARTPPRHARPAPAAPVYGKGLAREEDPVIDLINLPRPEDASRAPEGGTGWTAFGAYEDECLPVIGCDGGDGPGGSDTPGNDGGGDTPGGGGNGNAGGGNDSGGNGNAGAGGGDGGGGPAF